MQVSVVFGHEAVVRLGFDVLEGCEEGGVAEGVFDEGETPAGEYTARTDFAELAAAVLPHCVVFAAQDLAGTEADGKCVERSGYH